MNKKSELMDECFSIMFRGERLSVICEENTNGFLLYPIRNGKRISNVECYISSLSEHDCEIGKKQLIEIMIKQMKYEIFNISKGIVVDSFNNLDDAVKFTYLESLKPNSDDFYYINKVNEHSYRIEFLVYGGVFFKEHHF